MGSIVSLPMMRSTTSLSVLLFLASISGVSAEFCASTNTGSSFDSVYSLYQSVGFCSGTCSGYAFAILQGHFCWCSNFSPDVAVSSSLCNAPCPGYPTDICGNVSSDLFSYVQIGQGSGVISQSGATSTSFTSNEIFLPTSTQSHSIATVTVNRGTTVVVTSFVPSEPSITLSSAIFSPASTSSLFSPTPTSSLGTGTTQPDNSQPTPVNHSISFWDSTGKVAGVFVAVGVVVALLAIALIWTCRKRRRRQDEERPEVVTGPQPMVRQISGSEPVSRSASLLQLLGKTRDRSRQEEIASPTSVGSRRLSRSPTDVVIPVVDQRLDPQSMMIRFDDNDSRTSFRDEEDYSRRVWRVTNASDSDSVRSS